MNTFIRFFYEFISVFFDGLFSIGKGFIGGIKQMFNFNAYEKVIDSYKVAFNGNEWIFVTIAVAVLVIIVAGIILLIVLGIKKAVRVARGKINQDSLLEEIADLNSQVDRLMQENNKIMAMKVSQLGLKPGEEAEEAIEENTGEEETDGEVDLSSVRFPKLVKIDQMLKNVKVKNYNNTFTLEEMMDNFRCFAATQLRLYYNPEILRPFIAGLACGRLVILQGISGTGKTSLAYAWGKFTKRDSCVASVEPSWRDKTEFVGYFNEFTKKFNETDALAEMYTAGFDDDVHTIILDEMNIARVEYYFAEMLSILEMPDKNEWIIELVTSGWPDDPSRIVNGKLRIPLNLWYIGTINNDDSTFVVTDKVYDRAMPLDINSKVEPFKCREQEAIDINSSYLESLFQKALEDFPLSDKILEKVGKMDDYVIAHFRVAFGNRIMKQLKTFGPVYMACGGKETDAVDYFIAKKIFRKFQQLNLSLIRDEIDPFISYLNKEFGNGAMKECIDYLELIKKSM